MQKLFTFMNEKFSPVANRISKNIIVSSIQDSIMTILPLILVGSIVTIVSLINEIVPNTVNLSRISNFSFGMVGICVSFLIPYNIMEKSKLNDKKLLAGATSLSLFLMCIMPEFGDGTMTFVSSRFGATGLVVAMVCGILVGVIMKFFSKFSFFKKDSGMPDFVIVWFDSLLPILFLLLIGYVSTEILNIDIFNTLLSIFKPLSSIVQTFGGFVLINFIQVFLYSFGISPWLLTPIAYPVYMQAISENAERIVAGQVATNIASNETVYALVTIGGLGATLMLSVLLTFFSKSKRLKAIGKATFIPSIFNINEPLIFGAPVAFNPVLMVGLWVNGIIIPALAYLSMSIGFVGIPTNTFLLWYLPYPIQSFLATGGDWRAVIMCLILMMISFIIWFPFVKIYDTQQIQLEIAETKI